MIASSASSNRNVITQQGILETRQTFQYNKTLAMLDFSGNCIGNEGIEHLSIGTQNGSALISLNCSHTALDQDCSLNMISVIRFCKIQYLDVSKNKLKNDVIFFLSIN